MIERVREGKGEGGKGQGKREGDAKRKQVRGILSLKTSSTALKI